MLNSPKAIHEADQAIAGVRALAASYGAFYNELVSNKVPKNHALVLTVNYLQAQLKAARQSALMTQCYAEQRKASGPDA